MLTMAGMTPALAAKPGGGGTATASVIEFSQCQNDAPPSTRTDCARWGNGALNSANSHYAEDQVTPQRLVLSTTAGQTNTVTIKYQTRKGDATTGIHAYDSLATWDFTVGDADRCQGLNGNNCPGGAASTLQMEDDPNVVDPVGTGISNVTSAHELPPGARLWTMYGGTLVSTTEPVHESSGSDDYAKVTVSFVANGSRAMLLFGGHIAASTGERGWGEGLGASNISGGPYHILLDALNGASAGSRDNQIQASAILPGSPDFTVTKTATPTDPAPGGQVTYKVTVHNGGTASGTVDFVDDFDDRLNPTTPTAEPPGGSCAREPSGDTNRRFICTSGQIAPDGSQVWTYTATMPSTFTEGAGTDGCGPGKFPVRNKVALASGDTAEALVCIAAEAKLTVVKTVNPSTANPGDQVTYTITITNDGKAAGSTTFTDNFDDRVTNLTTPTANPAGGSCTLVTEGDKRFECTSGVIPGGGQQVWTYKANMPTEFTGEPGGDGCKGAGDEQQYPVRNVVVLANNNGDDAVVCVNAEPSLTVVKSGPATAKPGDTVTYTITITNGGKAPGSTTFTDDYDDRLDPTSPSAVPAGGSCTKVETGNERFECTSGVIEAGKTQVWTYTAVMPTTFEGTPGGNGCKGPGTGQEFPIRNTVVLGTGGMDDHVVCVNAEPKLRITKTASKSTANPGEEVTYTIRVINDGTAPGSTGFVDDYDDRIDPPLPTANPTGGSCTKVTSGNDRFECTSGVVAAKGEQVWTYTVKMPSTFKGTAGTNGCANDQYAVINTVKIGTTVAAQAVVCVNAKPAFTVEKSADPGTAVPGQTVTYTIKVTNGGTAAGSTTFDDNFDDRIDPTTPTPDTGGGSCTRTTSGDLKFVCTSGEIDAGQTQTWTYTAKMPATFGGSPGGNGCNPAGENQQYPIRNVVVLANGTQDDATVCVSAKPELVVEKTASPAIASPGETVTYTVTVTNNGTAPGSTTFTDNFDDRLSPTAPSAVPSGGSCTVVTVGGDKRFDCTSGTVAAKSSQVWTYTAKMPTAFTGAPGGDGCNPAGDNQQFPVRNVVVLANGDNDDAVVCVKANPNLELVKSVKKTTNSLGQEVLTYTLTWTNTGAAQAPVATIGETVPNGTTYSSCTGGCQTSGTPVSGVTWTVGPIAPNGGTGSVTMTVIVTTTVACDITNTATIKAVGFNGGQPKDSNTVSIGVTPLPDPDNANTSAESFGAEVTVHALIGITTSKLSESSTSQHGVGGPSIDSDQLLGVNVGGVLEASALRTTSRSGISAMPALASSTSSSEVLGVCIIRVLLTCAVEASTVRAVAYADASGTNASISSAGTTIQNLKVAGVVTPVDLNQTTTIPLPAAIFGAGSYVAINERTGGTSIDNSGDVPRYRADLTVNMIRVHVTGALGVVRADVTVGHAEAHADFPVQKLCGPQTERSVAGHAFVAQAAVLPPLVMVTQGFVAIPASGGSASQQIASANAVNGQLLTAGAASTAVLGSTGPPAVVNSKAQVASLCLLKFPASTNCVVMAEAVKSNSVSAANNGEALSRDQTSATDKTQLVNLVIRSAPNTIVASVPLTTAPNTTITIPGIGFIVLNEQTCDGGATLNATAQPRCTGTTHSGLTVRALHLVLLQSFGPFSPGVEVILAEAYSGATSN